MGHTKLHAFKVCTYHNRHTKIWNFIAESYFMSVYCKFSLNQLLLEMIITMSFLFVDSFLHSSYLPISPCSNTIFSITHLNEQCLETCILNPVLVEISNSNEFSYYILTIN